MRDRGITEEEVTIVLSNPNETVATRANRMASYGLVRGKYIVVIHEKSSNQEEYLEDVIITAMKVNRRRLARFGFAQV
jgi:hypothetical protein